MLKFLALQKVMLTKNKNIVFPAEFTQSFVVSPANVNVYCTDKFHLKISDTRTEGENQEFCSTFNCSDNSVGIKWTEPED